MKTNERPDEDVPVKERDDGTALASIDDNFDPFEDEDDNQGEIDGFAEGGRADQEDGDESEEDREAIRAARREERQLKKALTKQREVSAKHKISALERRNEDLARRLAQVENTATSFQFAQMDRFIEDEATRVEYTKMKMTQAAEQGNVADQMELLDQYHEAKNKLTQAQYLKQQQLEAARNPRNNVPSPNSESVQENATSWMKDNRWYDPSGKDTDSRIAKIIDNDLASEGWDPADPEYWGELDNRLRERLPHRYSGKVRRSGTSSSRSDTSGSPAMGKNTFTLSRERVQALKDAGMWDDSDKRAKAIRNYAEFDRKNRRG
jgi:hypothetical protein